MWDRKEKITINKDKSFMLEKINKLDDKHKKYEKTPNKNKFVNLVR